MKRKPIGNVLALFIVAMSAASVLTSCVTKDIVVRTPDLSTVVDGEYRGFFDGGIVKAEVSVSISAGRIASVRILRHDCGRGKPAEVIVDSVVAAQSLEVDVISGASYSSKVILKAIEVALSPGGR